MTRTKSHEWVNGANWGQGEKTVMKRANGFHPIFTLICYNGGGGGQSSRWLWAGGASSDNQGADGLLLDRWRRLMIEGRTQEAPWMGKTTLKRRRSRERGLPRYSVDARPAYRRLKRGMDLVLAVVFLVLLSPVLAAIALAIRLDSSGPIIFAQERMGKDGRRFTCYKFRSMYHNHGQEHRHRAYVREYINGNGAQGRDRVFKPDNGAVVTRVGRFLRRTSLDELPQLWNILKGDMSFVGPRPLVTYEMEVAAPWHQRRLEALPGLTGLVQVSGRSSLTFDEMVRLDLYYIEHSSLWLDLKILLQTVPVVLLGQSTR